MYEEQERLITEQATDYVVIRWTLDARMEDTYSFTGLYENYRLVATATEPHDEYCYGLWKKKESTTEQGR